MTPATAPAAPKEASDAQRDSVLVLRAARNVVAHVQATIRPHRSGEGGVMTFWHYFGICAAIFCTNSDAPAWSQLGWSIAWAIISISLAVSDGRKAGK